MKPVIYKYGEFDHKYEEFMFDELLLVLSKVHVSYLLLGNYTFGGLRSNAVLITSKEIRLFIFKDYFSEITPSKKDVWTTSDGKIIEGGLGAISPYKQAHIYKEQGEKWFGKILPRKKVKVCVVFQKGTNLLPSDVDAEKDWLHVLSVDKLNTYLDSCLQSFSEENFDVNKVVSMLEVDLKGIDVQKSLSPAETVFEFFEELEAIPATLSIRDKYAILDRVLNNAVNQKIKGKSLKFTGLFSKIQYLIREYKIYENVKYQNLTHAINDVRVRLRKIDEIKNNELACLFGEDLRAVCTFISCIYDGRQIPLSLSSQFPVLKTKDFIERLKDSIGKVVDCIRCVVNEWDATYLYVTRDDNGENVKVDYVTSKEFNQTQYSNRKLNESWSYIGLIIEKGEILNLVKPRIENGILYPELIIVEPDYLVNVTTIANCFEEYGDSYKMNLIKKIEPMVSTPSILLGNFAGQLLDEASYKKKMTYEESLKSFFKKNALAFACCKDPLATFHIEAQNQKRIIEEVLDGEYIHKKDGSKINVDELILEPSYFCGILGLQGRLDFIGLNLDTIIEQKSGKSAWSGDANTAKHLQKHYVQLLLYRAIFHYSYKKMSYDKLASWLFYSKYAKGLLGLGSAPVLLFKALKIRNLIVWAEKRYAKNGFNDLEKLSADAIFPNVKDKTYLKWGKDKIEKVLAPLDKASELEKAYYYRYMQFVATEHMLSKIGNKTKEESGFATLWNSSLQERKDAGNIYTKLKMEPLSPNSEVEKVKFFFDKDEDLDVSNFRMGDIVVFYPYLESEEPKVTSDIVFRGTIIQITLQYVEVELRNSQHQYVFTYKENENKDKTVWAIEHDFMESSYSSLYKGMHAFLSANQDRKDLILGQRKPSVDESVTLSGNYGSQEFNELVLHAKQAKDLYLIVGPPGTGKTSYGMLNVLKEHLTDPNVSILLMAYTNRAVDEICSKLVENNLDFLRLGSNHGCSPEYRKYLLDDKMASLDNIKLGDLRTLIVDTKIFCGTTTAFISKIEIFNLKKFDLAIIDEASQILEPFVLGLLSAKHGAENAIAKFVLIGDEKQLPAVVQQEPQESMVNDPMLNKIELENCRLSLFERFEKLLGKNNKQYCHVLTHQGRMHPEIAKFPNYTFYQNSLKVVPVEHQKEQTPSVGAGKNGIEDLLTTRRVSFLSCTPSLDPKESDKVNGEEAKLIAATVVQAYLMMKNHFDINKSIGVIVPYRNQISTVRNMIDNMSTQHGIDCLHDITIDTVERYQGSQRDLIIYGFTAKKHYQLAFLTSNEYYDENDGAIIDRKLNVAMTRAKKNLVLVGYERLLAQDITFYKLIEYCKSIQSFFEIDVNKYVKGEFSVSKREVVDNATFDTFVYTVDDKFEKAFNKLVVAPIKQASNTEWPNYIFGNKMEVNMNLIGYGRIDFSNQLSLFSDIQNELTVVSPQQQVLLYGYYIMRQHYCSLKAILNSYRTFLQNELDGCKGRVHYIDIGCGPSTCISAFMNEFSNIEQIDYVGVDISVAMQKLGQKFLQEQAFDKMNTEFVTSFNELTDEYWDKESQVSSLFIINFSYFFSNVKSDFTEKLAMRMVDIIRKYPLNRYVFVIQQSETDCKNFRSYSIFRRIILEDSSLVKVLKHGEDNFCYQLNGGSKSLKFCYDIWSN